jgi:hypothetical protein
VNFALPAITLLLLLLPGILAVQGFLGRIGRKTSDPVGQAGLTWAGLLALLIAPLIHLVLCAVLAIFKVPPPDLHAVIVLLSGQFETGPEFERTIAAVIGWPWHITLYFVAASMVGLVAGWAAQRSVRTMQLDRTFSAFRFASDWHYLFKGEIRPDLPKPEFVVVAATVEHAGQAYLYVGVLRHYAVDRQGQLERIHMNSVVRRPLGEDRRRGQEQQMPDKSGRFYPVTGDELVIVFRDVRTLNVRYMYLKPKG